MDLTIGGAPLFDADARVVAASVLLSWTRRWRRQNPNGNTAERDESLRSMIPWPQAVSSGDAPLRELLRVGWRNSANLETVLLASDAASGGDMAEPL